VGLDGADADRQRCGDLWIHLAFGGESQHLALAGGQCPVEIR
jgi:hypothetical protein